MLTIQRLYDIFIEEGIKEDSRSRKQIQSFLSRQRKIYKETKASEKKFFDKDRLTNPYADTRILFGDPKKKIRRILVGIDMEVGELMLAHQYSQMGKEIDLILAHHPEGIALSGLDEVMHLQTDLLMNLGFQEKVAKDLMTKRIKRVSRGLHGANHTRTVDAARLLNMPIMCCHTPADNHVNTYLQKLVNRQKPKTLNAIVNLLMKEPEYRDAVLNRAGPRILVGKEKSLAGKIQVDMTGGTEGSEEIFARMSQLGVNTYLGMHLSESHLRKIRAEHMNVIIAGHMASDNLGMNLLLDKVAKKYDVEIVACSGYRRFKH